MTETKPRESLASRMAGFWIFGTLPLFIVAVTIINYFGNQNPGNAFYIDVLGYGAVAAFAAWVAYYMGRDQGRKDGWR